MEVEIDTSSFNPSFDELEFSYRFDEPFSEEKKDVKVISTFRLQEASYFEHKILYQRTPKKALHSNAIFSEMTPGHIETCARQLISTGVPLDFTCAKVIYPFLATQIRNCLGKRLIAPLMSFLAELTLEFFDSNLNRAKLETISMIVSIFSIHHIYLEFPKHPSSVIAQTNIKTYTKIFNLCRCNALRVRMEILSNVKKKAFSRIFQTEIRHALLLKNMKTASKVYLLAYPHNPDHKKISPKFIYKRYDCDLRVYLNRVFLKERSVKSSNLSDQEKINFSLQLAFAVKNLHEKGLIHRDIKPSNILIEESTKKTVLCDFGAALKIDMIEDNQLIVGTLRFIPPEIFIDPSEKKHPNYSFKTDIWSLGCVYFILWAEKPFPWWEYDPRSDQGASDILSYIKSLEEKPAKNNNKDSLYHVYRNMMRRNPKDRWDIDEVIQHLQMIQRDLTAEPSHTFRKKFKKKLPFKVPSFQIHYPYIYMAGEILKTFI